MTKTTINLFQIVCLSVMAYAAGTLFTIILMHANGTAQSAGIAVQPAQTPTSILYVAYLLVSIVLMAVMFRYKKAFFQKLLSRGFVFISAYYIFGSVLMLILYPGVALGLPLLPIEVISLFSGCVIAYLWYRSIGSLNIYAFIIAVATIGAVASSFSPFWILIIFIIMAVWDLIAVFKLKFMQALAGIAINGDGKRTYPLFIYAGNMSKLRDKLTGKPVDEDRPALLGLGDIIIPGAFMASAVVSWHSSVYLFSLALALGLVVNMAISSKYKRGIPALPVMLAFSILAVVL